jgi:hypothetical protein
MKCDCINSYLCIHLLKTSSEYILILSFKDDFLCHEDFVKNWSKLSEAEFVRQTFAAKAQTAYVLVGRISKLVTVMERKTSTSSAVTLSSPGNSGRSFLTDAQNVLRGSPKRVPQGEKSSGKQGGKGTKGAETPTQESTPKSASSKLVKKFFISAPRSNSLWQDDCESLFQEHKRMYGNFYCFGIEEKKSVDILNVIREAPVEMQVRSLEQRRIDNIYNQLSASPII